MKYKVLTKVFSLFLAILFIASSGAVLAFAADNSSYVPTFEDIEETDVIADLTRMGIDYQKYPKDLEAEHVRLLYFLEYGFDYYKDNSEYALYLYVWNPTGKKINTVTGMNSIQMRVSPTTNVDKDGEKFLKYKLQEVGASTTQGWENVFYKFKVLDAKGFLSTLNQDMRVYDISGIELQHQGNAKPKDYKVGRLYTFTGFQSYHGVDKKVANTLKLNATDRLTIEVELTPVSWKTKTSDKGAGYQYEMFSVYFSIPNDIIDDYGNPENEEHRGLVEINGKYNKHRINGVVTNNTSVYDIVYSHLNKNINYDSSVPFGFYVDRDFNATSKVTTYYWPFNLYLNGQYYNVVNQIHKLCSVVEYSGSDFVEITNSNLLNQLNSLWSEKGFNCTCDICNSTSIIGPFKDQDCGDNKLYTVKSGEDLAKKISTYASSTTKFQAWLSGNSKLYIEDESYEDAKSIQAIKVADLYKSALQDVFKEPSVIGENYFMSESDASNFLKFTTAEALKDKTTYLMRFAVDDYYFSDINLTVEGQTYSNGEYYFEKTIFTDIDVFTFTFENKYSQRVTIPVVASPIDNVGSITPTEPEKEGLFGGIFGNNGDNDLSLIGKLLKIIIVVLILAVIVFAITNLFGVSSSWLFTNIAKVLKWVLSLPFKLVSWIFGIKKDSKKSQSEKKKE